MSSSTQNITIRPYRLEDHEACMKIFDTNAPPFFDPDERVLFEVYLLSLEQAEADNSPQAMLLKYFVLEGGEGILGCGGYSWDVPFRRVTLTWGMVRNDLLKHGLGRILLDYRHKEIREINPDAEIFVDTSQYTQGFFAKYGFKLLHVEPDFWGKGLDKYAMALV